MPYFSEKKRPAFPHVGENQYVIGSVPILIYLMNSLNE